MIRRPSRGILGEPLPGHHLKTVCCLVGLGRLLRFAVLDRIDAMRQQLARCIATVAGFFQTDIGVHSKGQPFFFPAEALFQPPPLAPSGSKFQIEPALIEQLDRLRTRLGVTDGSIG